MTDSTLRRLTGLAAIGASSLHSLTDVMELLGDGFSTPQLALNYAAFVAVPFVVIGIFVAQRPHVSWLGFVGALLYGAAFVYFAGTSVYALTRGTADYEALLRELGGLYTAHGAAMIAGGLCFGASVVTAGVLPRWTGLALMMGVTANLVFAWMPVPPVAHTLGSLIRNVAFIGMGAALVRAVRTK